jgi:hypothetical protein
LVYTLEELREHYNKQQLARQFAGERWQKDDLIFTTTIGTPLDLRNVYSEYKVILEQAACPTFVFMTCGTQQQPSFSSKASTPRSFRSGWGTPKSA